VIDLEELNKEWKELDSKEAELNEELSKLNKKIYEIREKKNELWHKATCCTDYVFYVDEWVKQEDVRENKLLTLTREQMGDFPKFIRMSEEELRKLETNEILVNFVLEVRRAGKDNNHRMQRILMDELKQAHDFFFTPVIRRENYDGYWD